MFNNANMINLCLSFYPFKFQLPLIKHSKKLQQYQFINIDYYKLLSSFKQDYNPNEDFSPYYDYYYLKYPLIPKERIKELFISFIQDKSMNNMISINSSTHISNEILNTVHQNIHLIINTYHFLFDDDYNIMNYTNIKEITFEFTTITKTLIDILFERIMNHNISMLNISIINECSFLDIVLLFKSLRDSKLKLEKLTLTITEGQLESVNKTLNIVEDYDTLGDEGMISNSYQSFQYYDFVFDFIGSLSTLKTLNISWKIENILLDGVKQCFSNLKHLENLSLIYCTPYQFGDLIYCLSPIANQIKNLKLDYSFREINPEKFEIFTNLENLELSEYVKDNKNYPLQCKNINHKRYYEKKANQYYRINLLKQNETIQSLTYKNSAKKHNENQTELVNIINSKKYLKELKIECLSDNISECNCSKFNNDNVEELSLSVNHEISPIIKQFINLKQIKGLNNEDCLLELNYNKITSIGLKGDIKKPLILNNPSIIGQFVNLYQLSLSSIEMTASNYSLFIISFSSLINLNHLSLYRFIIKDVTNPLISLFTTFKQLNKIKSLSIISCNLNSDELVSLCQHFKYLPLLNSLSFNQSCKNDSPFYIIADYIKDLANVRYISFQHNTYISNYEYASQKFKNCIVNCYNN